MVAVTNRCFAVSFPGSTVSPKFSQNHSNEVLKTLLHNSEDSHISPASAPVETCTGRSFVTLQCVYMVFLIRTHTGSKCIEALDFSLEPFPKSQ